MENTYSTTRLAYALLLLGVLFIGNSCKKAEDAWDEAFKLEGYFTNTDGTVIELKRVGSHGEFNGIVTKLGAGIVPDPGFFEVGTNVILANKRTSERTWNATVPPEQSLSGARAYAGIVEADGSGNTITIKDDPGNTNPITNITTPYSLTRTSSATGGSGSGTGSGVPQTLVSQLVSGKELDKIYVRFTVPAGVKSMTVTTTSAGPFPQYYYNLNDLFVRQGSDPTCTQTPRYTWVADCAGIQPNNVDEVCTFTNPGAGSWSAMLYGYNSRFDAKILVTLVK